MNLRYIATAAATSIAVLGLSQTAHAVTWNTMRPTTATAYCNADILGAGQPVILENPCNSGTMAHWGVESSPFLGGEFNGGYQQIANENLPNQCIGTNGFERQVTDQYCNGDEAQAWELVPDGSNSTLWVSAYYVNGDYLCINANASAGTRAWPCDPFQPANADRWDGPQ